MANFHSIGGNEVEAHYYGGELEDELDSKAYSDGYYAQLTAGAADNLTGRGDATAGEYLFRTTAGTASVSDEGVATVKSIKGRTLRWNQLVNGASRTVTANGVTYTLANGKVTLSGTPTGGSNFFVNADSTAPVPIVSGHRYVVAGGDRTRKLYVNLTGVGAVLYPDTIYTAATDAATGQYKLCFDSNSTTDGYACYPMVFDLTVMFGAGNEPSTVAEFEAMYPKPYYPYDAGSLKPVSITGIETTGFNQWDEEWELGTFNTTTGADNVSTTQIRAKNLIPVLPNMEYYCNTSVGDMWIMLFDANKTPIAPPSGMPSVSGNSFNRKNNAFTTTADARYMRFYMTNTYGTTYKHDICINLSWSGYRNGEYEPYWSAQREIAASTYFPDGMRSAGSVYDELTSTEAIQRVGVVDLGTLNWTPSGQGGSSYYSDSIANAKPVNNVTSANVICAKYEPYFSGNGSTLNDKMYRIGGTFIGVRRVSIRDDAYQTAAAFKTAMSGVYLLYELDTPTVTPIDPPLNLDYRYADFGTERIMVPEGVMSAPPIIEAVYGINATDTIRNLPTDYTSKKSLENLIATLDAHNGTTTTMTWNEGQQAYTFAIADNE